MFLSYRVSNVSVPKIRTYIVNEFGCYISKNLNPIKKMHHRIEKSIFEIRFHDYQYLDYWFKKIVVAKS